MTRLPPCSAVRHPLARATFWSSVAALAWTQVGYGAFLAVLRRAARAGSTRARGAGRRAPAVALIVAAYAEEDVIAAKVANALALDWPRERLQVVVAVDGGAEPGADATAERARAAGADLVLELPRGGKVRAQDAAVAASRGELVAFTDANAAWEPGALRALAAGVRRPAGGLRLRAGDVRQRGGDEPGGRLLALRDVAAGQRVRARLDHGGQRRDLRGPAPGLPPRRRGDGPRPLVPVQHRQARAARGLRAGARGRRRRWSRRSRARARASGG